MQPDFAGFPADPQQPSLAAAPTQEPAQQPAPEPLADLHQSVIAMRDTVWLYVDDLEKADKDKIIEQMSEINPDAAKAFAEGDMEGWTQTIKAGDEA